MRMELMVSVKGHHYVVEDKKHSRLLYTIKKKGLGSSKYLLLDASKYQLYTFTKTVEDKKPTFIISNNDIPRIRLTVKSLFLDPSISVTGKDTAKQPVNFLLASKDHKEFTILRDETDVGKLSVHLTVSGELQYELHIEDKIFDDFIPLFAVAVDITFGEMNQGK